MLASIHFEEAWMSVTCAALASLSLHLSMGAWWGVVYRQNPLNNRAHQIRWTSTLKFHAFMRQDDLTALYFMTSSPASKFIKACGSTGLTMCRSNPAFSDFRLSSS